MQNVKCRMKNRILGSVVFAFASLVFVLPVSAQKETPPEGGSPKAFVFPKQDTYALPNGLKVTMVQYGLTPGEALDAATVSARRFLGVEEGDDLVTYHTDPLADPSVLASPAAVVLRGERVL